MWILSYLWMINDLFTRFYGQMKRLFKHQQGLRTGIVKEVWKH